ncbi:MAG: hypothetical protein PHN61_11800 [Methanothrix sp.]|nr:hypothetical protein [Methanothrix sp.]
MIQVFILKTCLTGYFAQQAMRRKAERKQMLGACKGRKGGLLGWLYEYS